MTSMFANVAVPIFFPQPTAGLLMLVPVVVIETLSLRRPLGLQFGAVFVANLCSAILGWVLCGVALTNYMSVSVSRGHIMVVDVLVMWARVLVPCFVLSVLLEGAYLRRRASGAPRRAFWFAITKAHFYSYLFLIGFQCLFVIVCDIEHVAA
jgi:hypothetical protein